MNTGFGMFAISTCSVWSCFVHPGAAGTVYSLWIRSCVWKWGGTAFVDSSLMVYPAEVFARLVRVHVVSLRDAFDRSGLLRSGFDRSGLSMPTLLRSWLLRSGLERSGWLRSGFDRSGFDRSGLESSRALMPEMGTLLRSG